MRHDKKVKLILLKQQQQVTSSASFIRIHCRDAVITLRRLPVLQNVLNSTLKTIINISFASTNNKSQRISLLSVGLCSVFFVCLFFHELSTNLILGRTIVVMAHDLLYHILATLMFITNMTWWLLASSTRPPISILSNVCGPSFCKIYSYVDLHICPVAPAHHHKLVFYNCMHCT